MFRETDPGVSPLLSLGVRESPDCCLPSWQHSFPRRDSLWQHSISWRDFPIST